MNEAKAMMELRGGLDSLIEVARALDSLIQTGIRHILLQGDLASGKTTLVRAYAALKGITAPITSPTFSLLHSYSQTFHHYDIYHRDFDELLALGLLDMLQEEGIHLIEWGDGRLEKVIKSVGFPVGIVTIHTHQEERFYRIIHA